MENLQSTLLELNKLAIFRLSLGSKELFHSNFLEYLWSIDPSHKMFVRIINEVLPKNKQLPLEINYEFSREKENFDICLYHEESFRDGEKKKTHVVYDLILENKVKSIPYKEQLKKYEDKINEENNPVYLLLSLVSKFPDEINVAPWVIVHYDKLKRAIESQKEDWVKLPDACYIEDYCNFIRLMHQLQQEILRDFQTQSIFKDVQTFKKYRLHDLYIKLRCANFLILLKEKLTNIGPVQFLNNYADIRNVYKKRGIYLNQNIFRSVGQAAAFLYKKDGKNNDIYEIVVQGNQYRHGINSYQLADFKKEKIESQNKLWEAFDQRQAEKEFLSLSSVWDGEVVLPQTIRNNNKSSTKKCAAFCGYNHDYIYKYKDITSIAVDELLNMMAKDIKKYYTTVVF